MTVIAVKSRRPIARIGALRTRHARLDGAIQAELKRPMACAFKLQSLKRLRLKVKDELQALKGGHQTAALA